MASSNLTSIFSCPSGGQWYVCSYGTKFVGCCASIPCLSNCPQKDLYPMSFDVNFYAEFSEASCDSGSNFYTCMFGGTTLAACCQSNPCTQGMCPGDDLTPAYLLREEQMQYWAGTSDVISEPIPVTTGPVARVSHAPAVDPYTPEVKRLNRTGSLTSVGVSIAIMILCSILLASWLGFRSSGRFQHDQQRSRKPEQEPFPAYKAVPSEDNSAAESPSTPRKQTDMRRLGTQSLYILGLTTLVELCTCGFLNFLWYGGAQSRTWNDIMVNGWATRSVAVTALVLRTAVDLQAALGSAIIASLFFESRRGTRLSETARISPIRAAGTSPWSFIWFALDDFRTSSSRYRESCGLYTITGCLLVTSSLLQFSSTILLSDLSTGPLVSGRSTVLIQPDLSYLAALSNNTSGIPRGSAWAKEPPSYAIFGEYHERPEAREEEVADTGLLLRAFLPYALVDTRQKISSYSGNSFVVDNRVSCQAPLLESLQGDFLDRERKREATVINGTTQYSTDITVNVTHIQLSGWVVPTKKSTVLKDSTSIPFNCTAAGSTTTVCQLEQADAAHRGLVNSQFERSAIFGTFFLLLKGDQVSQKSGPWINFTVTHTDQRLDRKDNATVQTTQTINASATLCFAPWNSAILNVELSSKINRTEPQLKYVVNDFTKYGTGGFQTKDVLNHFIPSANSSTRQILAMEKPRSYLGDLPPAYRRPIIQSDISGSFIGQTDRPLPGNWSVVLSGSPLSDTTRKFEKPPYQFIAADPAIAAIFDDALNATSVEWALSSVITVLSMTNYYGQLPAFDRVDNVTISNFEDVLYPRDHLGLTLLMWALTAHLIVVAILVVLFVLKTRLTLLGNTWSAFLQLAESPEVMEHMERARGMTDSEVLKRLKEVKKDGLRARIVRQGEAAEVTVK